VGPRPGAALRALRPSPLLVRRAGAPRGQLRAPRADRDRLRDPPPPSALESSHAPVPVAREGQSAAAARGDPAFLRRIPRSDPADGLRDDEPRRQRPRGPHRHRPRHAVPDRLRPSRRQLGDRHEPGDVGDDAVGERAGGRDSRPGAARDPPLAPAAAVQEGPPLYRRRARRLGVDQPQRRRPRRRRHARRAARAQAPPRPGPRRERRGGGRGRLAPRPSELRRRHPDLLPRLGKAPVRPELPRPHGPRDPRLDRLAVGPRRARDRARVRLSRRVAAGGRILDSTLVRKSARARTDQSRLRDVARAPLREAGLGRRLEPGRRAGEGVAPSGAEPRRRLRRRGGDRLDDRGDGAGGRRPRGGGRRRSGGRARLPLARGADGGGVGLYFAKLWYWDRLYPLIFTVGALSRARS